jgi:hypothetical protein
MSRAKVRKVLDMDVEFEVVSRITTVSFEFTRNNGTLVQGTIDVSEDDINFDSEIPLTKKEEELLQEKVFDYLSSSYD